VVADVSMNCGAFIFKDTQAKNCFTLKKIQSFETMGTTCPVIQHYISEYLSSATLDVNSKCCTL
jgi:hypothetical protein